MVLPESQPESYWQKNAVKGFYEGKNAVVDGALIFILPTTIIFSLVGLVLGIIGFFQRRKSKLLPVIGALLNVFPIFFIVFAFLIATYNIF